MRLNKRSMQNCSEGEIIDLGGTWALLCPACNEVSIA